MPWQRWASSGRSGWQLARLAWELPGYLREPLDSAGAAAAVRQRLAQRDGRFLAALRMQTEARASGPLARLLAWAGWSMGDVEAAVRASGLDATLERLRDAGVFFSHAELTGAEPLRRPGLELMLQPSDFDRAGLGGPRLGGTTSGTRSNGIRVFYTWEFLAEEAANELLLCHAHGMQDAPLTYWMPAVPGLSGIHNLLFDLKSGRAPRRWFAQVDGVVAGPRPAARAATGALLHLAFDYVLRRCRQSVPWTATPERTPLGDADRVAAWLAATVERHGGALLKCYASAAVRVAAAAQQAGIDLGGCLMFTGGEPLTDARRRFIEASGARVFPRYVTTEMGLMAGACARRQATDTMHVYLDRIAAISASDGEGLLFTSLSPHAGKVLLNADLGDAGVLERRACGCPLGQLGFDLLVQNVRSDAKLAGEGVKMTAGELDALVAPLIEAVGGRPQDYQFWQAEDHAGRTKLMIAVDPSVARFDEPAFIAALITSLKRQPLRGNLTGQLWEQGATVQVVRETPTVSRGHKQHALRS